MTSGPHAPPGIPATADSLTPGWFSAILSATGPQVEVESVTLERLGGLASMVYRVRLAYSGARKEPDSVVVKLSLNSRPGGPRFAAPGFDREVRFYREVAPRMNVAVPHAFWTDADPETGDYVIVIEDFPNHTACADDGFATREQARLLLTEIARVHAAWWGSAALESYEFLRTLPDFITRVETQLHRGVPLFIDRFAGRLDRDERAVFAALPGRFRAAVEPLGAVPATLVHHDLSLRNALLGVEGSAPPIVLIDWQLAQRTAGVRDVSFLVGAAVPAELRTREEEGVLRHYLDRLQELGVTGYTYHRLREDYRRSVICDFGRMVMTAGQERVDGGMEAAVAHQLTCRRGSARELDLAELL